MIDRIEALQVGERSLAFWGLGRVGVAVKGAASVISASVISASVIYIDPYLINFGRDGRRLDRISPPPITPDEVADTDAVVLTHDHADHLDPETILPVAKSSPGARFVAPFTGRDHLVEAGLDTGRVAVPEIEESFEVIEAKVAVIPSAHTELEQDPERGYPYLGYVIEWNGVVVYHVETP